jgi:glutamine synthetase
MQMMRIFTQEEIAKFISGSNIKILNLCHIPEDGRLRTLSFVATDPKRTEEILQFGERVDGSSLFRSIEPGKSDIYIMPRLDRVFTDPFSSVPTINILCDYLDEDGKPLDISPKNVLEKAQQKLHTTSDIDLKALVELEFYLISKQTCEILFPAEADRNYHESAPFALFGDLRNEVMLTLADIGIATKYGHSEVGHITGKDGTLMEQQEIEFKAQNLVEIADAIPIAKWVIRNICVKHGVSVSFSPKVSMDHAGNGMHIHLCATRKGKNITAGPDGTPSPEAQKIIGGILKCAPSLSAFGNPTPASYLRLIARKESPLSICWSARDRLSLIRIPLWWDFKKPSSRTNNNCRETFEYRAPDAFANTYLLLAGITVAADYGLEKPTESLRISKETRVVNSRGKNKTVKALPRSCSESAIELEKHRRYYEADSVFPKKLIDKTIETLKSFRDGNLRKNIAEKPEEIETTLERYLHYG